MTEWRDSRMPWRVSLFRVLAAVALGGFPLLALSCFQAKPVTGATVTGVLLDPSGAPHPKTQIRLIKVRLVSVLGQEIRTLPPNETVIIDSDGKAVAVVKTDSAGKFEFKEIQTGRYSVALPSKGTLPAWLESGGKTVFFDVVGNQRVDIGTVNPSKQR